MSSSACNVCGNTTFDEDEGFSFCQECGTQVEVTQRQEATDDMVMGGGRWASERVAKSATSANKTFMGMSSQDASTVQTPTKMTKKLSLRRSAQVELADLMYQSRHLAPFATEGEPGKLMYDDVDISIGDDTHPTDHRDDDISTESDSDRERSDDESMPSAQVQRAPSSQKSRSWSLVQALQVVLREQVDALVCNGYPTELEDVAGQLWFMYLRYTSLAFTGKPDEEEKLHSAFQQEGAQQRKKFRSAKRTPGVAKHHRQANRTPTSTKRTRSRKRKHSTDGEREEAAPGVETDAASVAPTVATQSENSTTGPWEEFAAGSLDEPAGNAVEDLFTDALCSFDGVRLPQRKKATGVVHFKDDLDTYNTEESDGLGSDDSGMMSDYEQQKIQAGLAVELEQTDTEDDGDGDNGAGGDGRREDDLDLTNPGVYTSHSWTNPNNIDITQPRMLHILAIVYLALLSLGEPLLATDICNMVKQGWFPYINVDYLLPDSMSLWNHQYMLFRPSKAPSARSVYIVAHEIATAVDLPLPPMDFEAVAARFLRELYLPVSLARCFGRLLLLAPLPSHSVVTGISHQRAWRNLTLDIYVMAALVVTVKLIYGLDDNMEWRQVKSNQKIEWDVTTQQAVKQEHAHLIPVWQDWIAMRGDCLRGSLSSPNMRSQRSNHRQIINSDMLVEGQHGHVLMPPPSLHSRKEVYGLRKDCYTKHRHTFQQASSGNTDSQYTPCVPANAAGTSGNTVRTVHAFPIDYDLSRPRSSSCAGRDSSQSEATPVQAQAQCLNSGSAYQEYKPGIQLHHNRSFEFFVAVCAAHIDCDVALLMRQIHAVEQRAFEAGSTELLRVL